MSERPDSPIPDEPTTSEDDLLDHDEEVVHHVSQSKKRRKGVGGEAMELQLTSMIDVIFQLLIYFVITANFMIDEGTILATLPGNAANTTKIQPPDPPVVIELRSADRGVTYALTVDGRRMDGVTELYGFLSGQVASGQMKVDDVVQIKPQGEVRWQHVVNVFNACVRAKLEEVGFAPS